MVVHVVAIVRRPESDSAGAQFVVRAGSRTLALWSPNAGDSLGYSEMARQALAQGQFETMTGWISVDAEPCKACGHYLANCIICDDAARHFLDAEWVSESAYLCDECVQPFQRAFDNNSEDLAEKRWERWEIGAYACCDGCECDTWK